MEVAKLYERCVEDEKQSNSIALGIRQKGSSEEDKKTQAPTA